MPGHAFENQVSETRMGMPTVSSAQSSVDDLISKISLITSPDDLEVQKVSNDVSCGIISHEQYESFCSKLYDLALHERKSTAVVVAICNIIGMQPVGAVKMRSLFLKHLQVDFFDKKDEIAERNWEQFVTSTIFLGEACCRKLEFLCEAVMDCLVMILDRVLKQPPDSEVDEDLLVVARQLHLNGPTYSQRTPDQLGEVMSKITEAVIVRTLNEECRLNLLAVLANLWPVMSPRLNPSTAHASMAAKLGLSLKL